MIALTQQAIDIPQVLALVTDPECGAEVLFVGTTRRWTKRMDESSGGEQSVETSHLIYEACEELALSEMNRLAGEAAQRWPVRRCAVIHRLGHVLPGEASVVVALSCPHRAEAFAAAQWLMDSIKHQVPIWKQEHYVQTGARWIHPSSGSCNCSTHSLSQQQSQQQ